jgi:hypothetical protein
MLQDLITAADCESGEMKVPEDILPNLLSAEDIKDQMKEGRLGLTTVKL